MVFIKNSGLPGVDSTLLSPALGGIVYLLYNLSRYREQPRAQLLRSLSVTNERFAGQPRSGVFISKHIGSVKLTISVVIYYPAEFQRGHNP